MKQQIITGINSINELPALLKGRGLNAIFFVTGKSSFKNCGACDKIQALFSEFNCSFFDDFSPNPTYEEVQQGVLAFKTQQADTVIAIGGGSSIDLAKSLVAFYAHPGQEKELVSGNLELTNNKPTLICIPTTAGTGSESTHFAVIYLNGKKYSIASPKLLPDIAILDAQFTFNLPQYITACTAFDALSQAVESYWSVSATSDSKRLAKQAIKIILDELPKLIATNNEEYRVNIMQAANLAGQAINITKTTAPHALSYTLTSEYDIPHGHAVAILLHRFLPFHFEIDSSNVRPPLTYSNFKQSLNEILAMFKVSTGLEAQNLWINLMDACGLESDLSRLGVRTEDDKIKIVKGVNLERLKNHPVLLDETSLLSLLN